MKDETMPPLPAEISQFGMVPTLKRIHELFYEYARAYAAQEVAKEREACALDIEHEASLWRGEEDISNFRLSAARVRSRGTQA